MRADAGPAARKPRARSAGPPNFPTAVPTRPGAVTQTPGSIRKRAKRVELSRQRKRVGYDRPIVVKRRQKVAAITRPAAAAAPKPIRAGRAIAPTPGPSALARDIATVTAPERKVAAAAAHVAGAGILDAGDVAGTVIGSGFGGKPIGDELAKLILGHKPKRPRGVSKFTGDVLKNLGPDVAELAVTTPSSIAKLTATAATHPKRLPGVLAQPYVELYHHPGKFISEHPVSAALMLQPAARLPGRAAGRVARTAGLQSRVRAPATVAGTPLLVAREGPRGLIAGALSARREKARGGPPEITGKQAEDVINSRVDEWVGSVQAPHLRRVAARAAQQSEERGHTPAKAANHMKGALGGARKRLAQQFADEFGDSEIAADRLHRHRVVGSSKSTGARVLRTSRRLFTGSVLPYSTKWMTGQLAEPALRLPVAGAGPLSWARARKLAAQHPEVADEIFARARPGGFGAETLAHGGGPTRTIAEEFEGAGGRVERTAKAVTAAGKIPGLPALRALNNHVRGFVFEKAAGGIERTTQTAMVGRAMKDLMPKHVIGLSDKAIAEAAQGLKATENQVNLARQVRRMYGQYSHFGPEMRQLIMHWTPFIPWALNTLRFLTHTLPVEHPMWAAAAADLTAAEEDWRKSVGQSYRGGQRKPGYMLGGYPVGDQDQVSRVGHFLPAAPGEFVDDPLGGALGFVLPQFASAANVARGRNVFGEPDRKAPTGVKRVGKVGVELAKSFAGPTGTIIGTVEQGPARQFVPGLPTRAKKAKKAKGKPSSPFAGPSLFDAPKSPFAGFSQR